MNQLLSLFERWFKSLQDLGAGFSIIGLVLFGLGNFLGLTFLVNLGFAAFGAGIVAWGVDAIQSGDMTPLQRGFRIEERAQWFLSRLWGLLFTLAGMLLLGYGVLSLLNPRAPIPASIQQFFETLQGKAVLVLVGSSIGALYSLTMIFISDVKADNRYVRAIKSLPGRFLGVLLLLFFGALAVMCLLTIVSPNTLQQIVQTIF